MRERWQKSWILLVYGYAVFARPFERVLRIADFATRANSALRQKQYRPNILHIRRLIMRVGSLDILLLEEPDDANYVDISVHNTAVVDAGSCMVAG